MRSSAMPSRQLQSTMPETSSYYHLATRRARDYSAYSLSLYISADSEIGTMTVRDKAASPTCLGNRSCNDDLAVRRIACWLRERALRRSRARRAHRRGSDLALAGDCARRLNPAETHLMATNLDRCARGLAGRAGKPRFAFDYRVKGGNPPTVYRSTTRKLRVGLWLWRRPKVLRFSCRNASFSPGRGAKRSLCPRSACSHWGSVRSAAGMKPALKRRARASPRTNIVACHH